jgi:putative spermidine/putrescine transport system permease protein
MMRASPFRLFVWTIVIFNIVFLALPTVVIVLASFTAGDLLTFPPEGFSLRWYERLAAMPEFHRALGRSLYVAAICTLFAIPAGTLAALAMVRYRLRFARALQLYFLLPFTVPLVVSGIGMMYVFGEIGILGQLWPVGLAACAINLPFMIWSVSAAVNRLDPDLEHAAANCGATPLQAFFTVTIPALMPGIITGALLMFILAMNEFIVSIFLVDARIVTLPVWMYTSIRNIITPDLAAVSVVYIVFAIVSILALDRWVGLDIFLRSK